MANYEFPLKFAEELIVTKEFDKNEILHIIWFIYEDQL